MFKKFLISFLLFTTLFTGVFAKPVLAQGNEPKWYTSDFKSWYLKVTDPTNGEDIFAERYTSAQVEWVFYGYFSFVLNSILGPDLANCVIKNSDGVLTAGKQFSIFGDCGPALIIVFGRLIDFLTIDPQGGGYFALGKHDSPVSIITENRPISGIAYIRDRVDNFGLVQEVSAQSTGFGFEAAIPVQALWVASRNITYFLMVVALVVMAFMIMFRIKNSPQTVITIQSVLPRIIVGIVLVTFSYAIAGLMIDLMYVVIGIMAGVLQNSGLFLTQNWGDMYNSLSANELGKGLFAQMFYYFILFTIGFFSTGMFAVSNIIIPGVGGILALIILAIAFIIIFMKIAWALTKNFVTILLLIAAGPFMILSGVVGGSGAGGWLKTLAAHLAVYPAVGALFALAFFFLANSFPDWGALGNIITQVAGGAFGIPFNPDATKLQGSTWVPPFTVVGTNANMIWLIVSLIILSLIPKATEIIQSAISGKPFAYGSAIGAPMAAAAGIASYPFAPVGQVFDERYKNFINNRLGTMGGIFQDIFKTKGK